MTLRSIRRSTTAERRSTRRSGPRPIAPSRWRMRGPGVSCRCTGASTSAPRLPHCTISRSTLHPRVTRGTWPTGGWPANRTEGGVAALSGAALLLTSPHMGGPLLQVQGLRTYFYMRGGVMRAVDGVDLVVEQGRTLGLVGESGCGKTVTSLSIMRLIDAPGQIEPGSKILFDGRDLAAADEDQLRDVRGNDISMIFQEPMTSLNPVYTVGDQIAEAVRLHQGVGPRAALDHAVEMMTLVGIPSPEKRTRDYPHQMSGGMRQRVMIAMALSCNPKLLIADEPTTA